MGKIGIDIGMVGYSLFPSPTMNEIPEEYLIDLIKHQTLIHKIETSLGCHFLICLDTQSLLLIDKETRLSVSIVPMTDNPLADLNRLFAKWNTLLITHKHGDTNEH